MAKFFSKLFGKKVKRELGTVMEPMTEAQAAAYWELMKKKADEVAGW